MSKPPSLRSLRKTSFAGLRIFDRSFARDLRPFGSQAWDFDLLDTVIDTECNANHATSLQ